MDALKSKVLVIDDDESILMLFDTILPKEGFSIVSTPRGGTGITMAHDEKPDIIILDLGLPDIPGLEVCRVIRQDPAIRHIPILMLTAQNNVQDKVKGLELGADDYLPKPFEPKELIARIRAILRRTLHESPTEKILERGNIRILVDQIVVEVNGQPRGRLTRKEFDLLYVLMKKSPQVLSRSYLIETVWGTDYPVTDRTVDATIKRLRQKLGTDGSVHIQTVEGFGYKFD
ncbi:MAG: response regulator transcription factor [Elusimicrobia bacterium]|nr:response regulator transcription factor [Candidatus Obscuribacterium magneticum]